MTIGQTTEKRSEAFLFWAEQRIMRVSHKGVQRSRGGAKAFVHFSPFNALPQ
jgi:hypothetical protein